MFCRFCGKLLSPHFLKSILFCTVKEANPSFECVLGERLLLEPVDLDAGVLPSPESLRRKILIADCTQSRLRRRSGGGSRKRVKLGLSSCVNYLEEVPFKGLAQSILRGKFYHMSSFTSKEAEDIIKSRATGILPKLPLLPSG